MRRPPPWVIAMLVAGGGLLLASFAFADEVKAMFPADFWNKKPLTGAKETWLREFIAATTFDLVAGGMPRSVAFGQAAVETGWGGAGRNNPWGKRGLGDAGSELINTTECLEAGKPCVKQTGQQFAKFSSPAAAARGYVAFLSGKNYKQGWHLLGDPGRWLLWLWGMGYATANGYASAVVDASRKIAVTMGDPSLAVEPWTPAHQAIAKQLSAVNAGTQRRELTRKLLGVA